MGRGLYSHWTSWFHGHRRVHDLQKRRTKDQSINDERGSTDAVCRYFSFVKMFDQYLVQLL